MHLSKLAIANNLQKKPSQIGADFSTYVTATWMLTAITVRLPSLLRKLAVEDMKSKTFFCYNNKRSLASGYD